jgi:hypothetical protein
MSWGDPHSRGARAVERRARRGLDTPARRRVARRAAVPQTLTRRAAESRHSTVWREMPGNPGNEV